MYTAGEEEDWRGEGWIDKFMTPIKEYEDALEAFDFYTGAIGAF